MQFSLRSRFRGAFLGAALGHVFGTVASRLSEGEIAQPQLGETQPILDLLHTAKIWQSTPPNLGLSDRARPVVALTHALIEPSSSRQLSNPGAELTSAIDFLPLMLLYHESPEQLQQSLLPCIADFSSEQQVEVITIALIVSRMLQEQFLPDRVIPVLLRGGLGSRGAGERGSGGAGGQGGQVLIVEQSSSLAEQLQQIQSWLDNLTPIAMLPAVRLSPLAAALYGFLKMPASFPLALLHTLRLQPDPEAAALVGLFAGSHLSEAGLPLGWRQALDRNHAATLQALWGILSSAELLDLSDRLWAIWSGAFQPHNQQFAGATVTAIPRLMRPR